MAARGMMAVAGVATLALAAALLMRPRRAPEIEAEPSPAATAAQLEVEPPSIDESLPVPATAGTTREPSSPEPAPSAIAPSAPVSDGPSDGDVHLDGTVVLVAEGGEERRAESGCLGLRVFPRGGERRDLVLPVTAGKFSASVPLASELAVARIELGSVLARHMEAAQYFPPPADGRLEIRASVLPSHLVHVVDAATLAPLRDVTVVRSSGLSIPATPAPHDVVVTGVDSPVRIETEARSPFGRSGFQVHAPGYAWAHRAFAALEPESTVTLEPGGDLLVDLENYRPVLPDARDAATRRFWAGSSDSRLPFGQPLLVLSRRGSADPPRAETPLCSIVPDPDAPTRIVGLEPGEYVVRVALHPAGEKESVVLGEADVTVEAGAESEVWLRLLDGPATSEPAPLSGTLHVPAAWGDEPMRIVFRPLDVAARSASDNVYLRPDDMVAIPGDANSWRWDARLVMPGRYAVELGGTFVLDPPVDVGEAGLTDLALALPAPADVTLRVVSAETGDVLDVDELTWRAVEADDGGGRRAAVSIGPTQLGVCRFRCPAGEVEIEGGAPGVEVDSGRIALVPGENDVTIRATLTYGVSIIVRAIELGREVPFRVSMTISYRRVDGAGPVGTAESENGYFSISVPEPGEYEFTLDPIAGFERTEPIRMTVGSWGPHRMFFLRPDGTEGDE